MKKIGVLTSGGDAPGMNAALRAVVRTALHYGMEVIAFKEGYKGLMNEDYIEMNYRSVSDCINKGGTILKTARCPEFKEKEYVLQAPDTLKAYGIDSLIVIGGDGSFRGAKDLSDIGGINVVAIPGTIDNDLAYTDYTLGFDTSVNTVMSAINNLRDTMISHDRASMLEVMGRKAGDIALYSAVAGGAEYCIIPEVPYDIEEIARSMKQSIKRGKTSNMIVLAEGAGDREEICSKIKEIAGISVKTTTLGHIQRGGSPSMFDRVLAAKMAVRAVDLILDNKTNRAIGIKDNHIIDLDITEALSLKHDIDKELYEVAHILSLHK
jgi:6-phosphofructokinase 1